MTIGGTMDVSTDADLGVREVVFVERRIDHLLVVVE
jgi:hypothetical protein